MSFRDRPRVRLFGAKGPSAQRDLLGIGIEAGRGLARALIFPGDLWAPDTVTLLSAALTPTAVVYADEDEARADGSSAAPRLKPEFSPEFLLSSAYIGRPLAMGVAVADRLPRLEATGAAALEHECALAATDLADTVIHIPEVLCHRTGEPDLGTDPASVRHVQGELDRRKDDATAVAGPTPGSYHIVRAARAEDAVSILIPFRDEPRLLRTCVDSIAATTGSHANVELVLIDNGSTDPETLTLLDRLAESQACGSWPTRGRSTGPRSTTRGAHRPGRCPPLPQQ